MKISQKGGEALRPTTEMTRHGNGGVFTDRTVEKGLGKTEPSGSPLRGGLGKAGIFYGGH